MSRIEKRFKIECDKSPSYSTLVNLGHAVQYQRFTRGLISLAFVKLVDPEDYALPDEEAIIDHLLSLSHLPNPKNSPEYTAPNNDPDLEESPES